MSPNHVRLIGSACSISCFPISINLICVLIAYYLDVNTLEIHIRACVVLLYSNHVLYFLIFSISPAHLGVPSNAPTLPSFIFLSALLSVRVAPCTYELKVECFWILISSCTSFPHLCHFTWLTVMPWSTWNSDIQIKGTRETDRLGGSQSGKTVD